MNKSLWLDAFRTFAAWCALFIGGLTMPAPGQCDVEKLLAFDGAASDAYGHAVSISGDVAIVGAILDADNGDQSGSAYVYRHDGSSWVLENKLLASDGAMGDNFGVSVSIEGDFAVVGAVDDDDNGSNSGAAYVFHYDGANWTEQAKLVPTDGAMNDKFGFIVSFNRNAIIVGAPYEDDTDIDSGSAYIFRYNGVAWSQETKLIASDGAANDLYGIGVSISGDVVVVGSRQDDDNGLNSGSAYIYRHNGTFWAEEAKLLASDGNSTDQFGFSVSLHIDVAIVGALAGENNGDETGAAYIYRYNGAAWVEETKLLASDGVASDLFGQSVSINGDAAIVGAYDHDVFGPSSGAAYVYRYNGLTWGQEAKLVPCDGAAVDRFGIGVSISGDRAIVGADFDDDNGFNSGSAYVFKGLFLLGYSGDCNSNGINDLYDLFLHQSSADCNDNGIPDECDIASGVSADVGGNGIPDECQANCPPDVNGDGQVNVTDLLILLGAWGSCF